MAVHDEVRGVPTVALCAEHAHRPLRRRRRGRGREAQVREGVHANDGLRHLGTRRRAHAERAGVAVVDAGPAAERVRRGRVGEKPAPRDREIAAAAPMFILTRS